MIGGSTVSMSFRQEIRQRLTQRLYVLWGTNECHTATVTRLSEVYDTKGGVGHPLPGFVVEIVDEQGEPLPSGVEGRLRVASATTITGYLGDDAASSKAFRGSWFYPGDLGCLSPNGQLIYKGRADDLMIVNGINVYPAEIEQCLRSLSGITDTVVTPLKHRVTQDVPVALVVLDHPTNLTPQVILKHVHDELGRHALHGLLILNKIPRNEQGKVQQELVKEILKKSIVR
jgi:acyl-coenzyme A synthetase/AMP-(fatty) acid ligase